jgi:hypothetical protein
MPLQITYRYIVIQALAAIHKEEEATSSVQPSHSGVMKAETSLLIPNFPRLCDDVINHEACFMPFENGIIMK